MMSATEMAINKMDLDSYLKGNSNDLSSMVPGIQTGGQSSSPKRDVNSKMAVPGGDSPQTNTQLNRAMKEKERRLQQYGYSKK